MNSLKIISAISFFISFCCFSQTENPEKADQYFVSEYQKITDSQDFDLKEKQSVDFSKKFEKFLNKNPKSFNYVFKKLIDSADFNIVFSKDKKIKFYSWDTQLGGTMRNFGQIIQYKSGEKVITISNNNDDNAYFISKIFEIKIKNQTYYLVVFNGIFSTKDVSQGIRAYTIKNGRLTDSDKIFKTKKETLNSISAEFDFFSVVHRPERPLELIKFNEKTNTLFFPVINKERVVTEKFLVYKLKNNYFEYIGIQ